jgi:hypothetical protein
MEEKSCCHCKYGEIIKGTMDMVCAKTQKGVEWWDLCENFEAEEFEE